jgi:23S rRNA (cytidine1920-2'-O)/16S rRNA (cytidine1409-2'-O)-methyltransferase
MVEAGLVLVGGAVADRASRLVHPGEPLVVRGGPPQFVGRGGAKLAPALDRFGIDVGGQRALDAGASTGGFTDCLLQRGAAEVVAVDVGHGQLHERLRRDPRVVLRERSNIRTADLADLGGRPFEVVTADLSFISLRAVADRLVALTESGGDLVLLVKPQFEAGRQQVSRGRGVIRDPDTWQASLQNVIAAVERAGAAMMGVMVSPLLGADGNVEFFAHFRAGRPSGPAGPGQAAVDAAISEASRPSAGGSGHQD